MDGIVTLLQQGPTSAELGEYTVSIFLADTPECVRINGERVTPDFSAPIFEWSKLPGFPIEIRHTYPEFGVQFRLID